MPLRGRFPEAAAERIAELEEVRTMPDEQAQEWTRQWYEESREQGQGHCCAAKWHGSSTSKLPNDFRIRCME